VPLIINDDMHLAQALGAEGVHLGQHDGDLHDARALLGAQAIIGITCYQSLDLAQLAQQQGANYVAFGRFFPSRSKPLAGHAPLSLLTEAKQHINIPIVAIGGILPSNAGDLLAAGADLLAVIDGLFASNPEAAVSAYQALFS
jgi:thiamine-phosphate pyrophosphorylase